MPGGSPDVDGAGEGLGEACAERLADGTAVSVPRGALAPAEAEAVSTIAAMKASAWNLGMPTRMPAGGNPAFTSA